jgi:hypothetical protein
MVAGLDIIENCTLLGIYEANDKGGKLLLRIQKGDDAFLIHLPDGNEWQAKAMEFIQNNKG